MIANAYGKLSQKTEFDSPLKTRDLRQDQVYALKASVFALQATPDKTPDKTSDKTPDQSRLKASPDR